MLDADMPALLRKGALAALGAQWDFVYDVLSFRRRGVHIPLRVNQMGDCILSVGSSGEGRWGSGRCSECPASVLE